MLSTLYRALSILASSASTLSLRIIALAQSGTAAFTALNHRRVAEHLEQLIDNLPLDVAARL
ncbi:MAG: hypothetical protein L0Z62_45850 [Gemmataceae bacterium]|nr:hypothetical protein [Gemmataceae bacterium]